MAIPNSFDILQAVIEATPDAIFVKDLDGRYVVVNEAAARFLGRSPADIIGKNDFELYPEETARQFVEDDHQVLASGLAQQFEGIAKGETGTQAYLVTKGVYRDTSGRILGLYGISHDITELRRAHESLEQTREALFRSQKMEAVGQLTGGIAHDFNNILAVILGNLELLKIHLRGDSYAQELLDTVLRASAHGQDLTGDLLAFSRRRQLDPKPVDLVVLLGDIVRLLGRTLGARINISIRTSADASIVLADAAALEAAVLNVALNARDAMPDGGSLTIRTTKVDVTERPMVDDDLDPGHYVKIEIEDTGCGMPADVAAHVFEPFFTTKSGEGGTGLGLSMVYGFAKQSGGTVAIQSEHGRGTTVTLFLPRAGADARPVPPSMTDKSRAGTTRAILVVEDDPAVRDTVRRQLEMLGHSVTVADTAEEALERLQTTAVIDVLLTDVVLGMGMNGIELVEAARRVRPGLPAILMSGYTAVPEAQQRIRDIGVPLLSKPLTISELECAVNTACE